MQTINGTNDNRRKVQLLFPSLQSFGRCSFSATSYQGILIHMKFYDHSKHNIQIRKPLSLSLQDMYTHIHFCYNNNNNSNNNNLICKMPHGRN